MSARKHVAVIGAGLAGLCSLKQLSEHEDKFTIVAFERAEEVGGQWLYTEETGTDKYGLPVFSSIYDDLVTNLPTCLNEIPGFPQDKRNPFCNRKDVFDYLMNYTDKYNLRQYIKFQTIVDRVHPLSKNTDTQWEVIYHSLLSPEKKISEVFDAVIACPGHNNRPKMPDIAGEDNFRGEVLHSHSYRRNTGFAGKRIVVLGASYSGMEITLQLAETAEKVFLAHRKDRMKTIFPANVEQRLGISSMTEDSVIFEDGTEERVEVVMYCTGYRYDMPFLEDIITVNTERVQPLFKHIVHIEHHTLMIVSVPKRTVYFVNYHYIVRFVVRYLLGQVNLPSKLDMYEAERKDFDHRLSLGLKLDKAHYMPGCDLQWVLVDELMELAGLPKMDPVYKNLWHCFHKKMEEDFLSFRKYKFEIVGSDSFTVKEIKDKLDNSAHNK